ncbi:MAG TPA: hypothetical protein VFK33_15600 [Bacillales bacterium]|nr:hypothetical protein [Bacillales bacterium]
MKEYIGECKNCGKTIYCENGFLNGVLLPGHEYLCWACDEKEEQKEKGKNP